MIVHAFTMVHNEETLMPYFMRHYKTFCAKITVYDNESTDRTARAVRQAGGHLIPVSTRGKHDVEKLREVMNEGYKVSRGKADWVVCAEGDEFFWHPQMTRLLEEYKKKGITLPLTAGFDMVADAPPARGGQIYEEITHGFPNYLYSKLGVFQPSININFKVGGHQAFPTGPVQKSLNADILLLHYRYLGLPYFMRRYEQHRRRLSAMSREKNWGTECLQDHKERYRSEIAASAERVRQIVP